MMNKLNKILLTVLKDFDQYSKSILKEKEKDPKTNRDEKGNIRLHPFDLKGFYNKENDILKPLRPHSSLEKLSQLLEKNYDLISVSDIFYVLPHVFYKVYNFILSDNKKISIDYWTSMNEWSGFSSWICFEPKNKTPGSIKNLFQENSLEFFIEIIERTLEDINDKYNDTHFKFKISLNSHFVNFNEKIQIDQRISANMHNNKLSIKGVYSGNPNTAGRRLQKDLFGILSILEMEKILVIKDSEKRIGAKVLHFNLIKNSQIELNSKDISKGQNSHLSGTWSLFVDHLSKFYES